MQDSDYSGFTMFIAGLCVGAGLGLMLAPKTGEDFRELLKDQLNKTREDLIERGREALQTAVQQGREYLESGAGERPSTGASQARGRSG